jgi:surface polysaccharide O-acyltransferase-like enzyme
MTQTTANTVLWTTGLLAQSTLLGLLFSRRLVRRLPAFALLLAFYILRSLLLFGLFGRLAPADYHSLYDALTFADLLLQLLVATALAIALWTPRRAPLLLLIPALATTAAWLLGRMLPANAPIPPDRIQIFDWLLFVLLGAAFLLLRTTPPLHQRLAAGFALYGALGIAATVLRTLAAVHRDAHSYALGSYALTGAWLLIVVYWIATRRNPGPKPLVPPQALRAE